jgi:predicted TIM-barrel fold metal-dependent hydrolase
VAFRYGDYSRLPRRYGVEDYRRDSARWPVRLGVYIEAEWDPRDPAGEMEFIAQTRRAHGFPTVAVAQAWLDRDDCAAVLASHAERGFVRGIRHKTAPGQMSDPRWLFGYARLAPLGLHFELQAPWPQLAEAAALARRHADTMIVVNHAGLPPASGLAGWREAMAALAACPNAMVKVSGLGNLDAAAKREAVLALIDLFGTRRAMFASNFPVDSLRDSFERIYETFDAITRGFSAAERDDLFHDNAVRLYRMQ